MTIQYAQKVACVSKIGSFRKVMSIYRGSVYKLTRFDLIIYLFLYAFIAIMYRFMLPLNARPYFESFVMYCKINYGMIPLTFVLAFYMNTVVQRWWETWKSIPWPDSLALKLNILFPNHPGREDECMKIKLTIMRYVNLSITETFRMISSPVKKRFPTYQHLVDAGLMTHSEMNVVEIAHEKSQFMNTFYWLPLNWAGHLLMKVEQEKMICRRYVADILGEINTIRGRNGDLLSYDWINVPIIYTQLVTIAVYSYFATSLFGRQTLDISEGRTILGYKNIGGIFNIVPLYLMLEFLFYVGWLKVAEVLINPYGEDDDDFETNYMIDRNLQICYLYFDGVVQHLPEVEKDPYWNAGIPKEMPYTIASLPFRKPNLESAAENVTVPLDQHQTVAVEDIKNFKKRSSIRNVSMRLQTAMGFNNIVKLVANPMIERNQRLSDSQFLRSADSNMKTSTISSPNLQHRTSMFRVENEKKFSSKENITSRKSTFSFLNRTRKDGLREGKLDASSSGETCKKLSNLLWTNDEPIWNPKSIEICKGPFYNSETHERPISEDKGHRKDTEKRENEMEKDDNVLECSSLPPADQIKQSMSQKNLQTHEKNDHAEILHHGTLNTPTIRRMSFNEPEIKSTSEGEE